MHSIKVFITSFLKQWSPGFLAKLKGVKKYFRSLALEGKKNNPISKQHLISDLQKAGVCKGDNIIVHSSLSKIGYVEGGASAVVDALLSVVGENGTLLMPSFAHDTFSKFYLDKNPIFDVLNSPSLAGSITENFRRRKGVVRSLHPTDSVAAMGPLADYFVSEHFGRLTPYDNYSPYFKLTLKNGKILNIGVPLNTSCTNLHTLEDAVAFKFPIYHPKTHHARVKNERGEELLMETKVHDPEYSKKRRPDELIPLFEKEGVLKKVMIGEASSTLIDAKGLLDVMIKHYHLNGVTMYTPHGDLK